MLYQPYNVVGFHSCSRDVALRVLNGKEDLILSNNVWDWLGGGIYFWEQNPGRALDYAIECSKGQQKNKTPIDVPFVLGAIIELGNCLNLVDRDSLKILKQSHSDLTELFKQSGDRMPINKGGNRKLDYTVFEYIHASNKQNRILPYDTVRCAFSEGGPVYTGTDISNRLHLQLCVRNPDCIKGYFLPRPWNQFNPRLKG